MFPELLAKIASVKPRVIALCGPSASGKGFVSSYLLNQQNLSVQVLGMDDYYKSESELIKEMGEEINWDVPEAVKMDLFVQHIQQLKCGETIQRPLYVNQSSGPGYDVGERTMKLDTKQILLVEGIFAADSRVCELADIVIFNHSSIHSRLLRRIIRDTQFALSKQNISSEAIPHFTSNLVAELFQMVFPENEKWCKPTQEIDVILSNEITEKELKESNLFTYTSEREFQQKMKNITIFVTSQNAGIASGGVAVTNEAPGIYQLIVFSARYNQHFYIQEFTTKFNLLPEIAQYYNQI